MNTQGFEIEQEEGTASVNPETTAGANKDVAVEEAEVIDDDSDADDLKSKLVVPKTFSIQNEAVNKATIEAMVKEIKAIKIAGVDDKVNYDLVTKKKALLRSTRTGLEKWRTSRAKPINAYLSDLKKSIDALKDECAKGETAADELLKPIDDEKARIKKEKEEAAEKALQERAKSLISYGAVFDGESYTFPFDESLFISAVQVKEFELTEFSEFLNTAKEAHEKEQERINAANKAKEEEEQANKLKLEQANAAIASLNKKRTELRIKELRLSGFVFAGGVYKNGDSVVTPSLVDDMEDAAWDAMITASENQEVSASPLEPEKPTADAVPATETPLYRGGSGYTSPQVPVNGFEVEHDEPADDVLNQVDSVLDQQKITESTLSVVQDDEQEQITLEEDPSLVLSTLRFDSERPFVDIDINAKFFQRFYPSENEFEAVGGIDEERVALHNTQISDFNLYFSLIKKEGVE